MNAVLLLGVFLGLTFVGVPIAVSLGLSSMLFLVFDLKVPLALMVQRLFGGIDSFPIMAIPFFVLAGAAMNAGGLTTRIVAFANAVVGWVRGGLALVSVVACMIISGLSGSAVADCSAIGGVMIPAMKRSGYSAEFAGGLIGSAAGLGPIIPPSITMVVYGVITGTSVTQLFIGGAVPGLIFGVGLMIAVYIISVKRNYPRSGVPSLKQLWKSLIDVFWALLMPIIVLGGIFIGAFTEAAAVSAVYCLFVGAFVYKELDSFKKLYEALWSSVLVVASVMILIACAQLYSWLLVVYKVPHLLTTAISSITSSPLVLLALINVVFLIAGMFIEANAAIILFVPILYPVAQQFGINGLHLGIILIFNLCLGLITPPVGLTLSLAAKMAGVPLHKAFVEAVPFLFVGVVTLLIITYIPATVTLLPSLLK
jgi:tripartite ATP-independent transporter DctM subunit